MATVSKLNHGVYLDLEQPGDWPPGFPDQLRELICDRLLSQFVRLKKASKKATQGWHRQNPKQPKSRGGTWLVSLQELLGARYREFDPIYVPLEAMGDRLSPLAAEVEGALLTGQYNPFHCVHVSLFFDVGTAPLDPMARVGLLIMTRPDGQPNLN